METIPGKQQLIITTKKENAKIAKVKKEISPFGHAAMFFTGGRSPYSVGQVLTGTKILGTRLPSEICVAG